MLHFHQILDWLNHFIHFDSMCVFFLSRQSDFILYKNNTIFLGQIQLFTAQRWNGWTCASARQNYNTKWVHESVSPMPTEICKCIHKCVAHRAHRYTTKTLFSQNFISFSHSRIRSANLRFNTNEWKETSKLKINLNNKKEYTRSHDYIMIFISFNLLLILQ